MQFIHRLFAGAAALALLAVAPLAAAQQAAIPSLIRVIIPFGAGTSPDVLGRAMAAQLATRLNTTVVVENRSGGSTMIGAAAVANGPKDGSILMVTSSSTYSAAATLKSIPFDLDRDLVPIAKIGEGPMMVVASAKSGIKSASDLVAMARAKPNTLTYGSAGIGSIAHLAIEMFADMAKIDVRHVPYKSNAFALGDLNGGTIDFLIGTNTTFASSIQSGRVNAIAMTSRQPSPAFPHLSTMASAAPGYAANLWVAVFAPAGIPPALAQRLNQEIREIARSKELLTILQGNDSAPVNLSLDELRANMREEFQAYKRLATEKKILAD